MAQLVTVATLQTAEVGKQLKFTQNSLGPNFTGSTVELIVSNAGVVNTYTCDVSSGSPVYTTTGVEFPNAGTNYVIQLKYSLNSEIYYSAEGKVVVLPNLVA
jgi:hypothetical protein